MNPHTIRKVSAFVLAATLIPVRLAFSQSPTFARTNYPSLGNDHLVGDFNGDGRPDLAGLWTKSAAIMVGNGDGTFQAMVEYPVASWNQSLAAGDFNRDGALDLMVTINDPAIGLSLLTGRGDGTFNAAVNFPNTAHLDSPAIAAVDLDNDLKLDVVIGHQIACYTAPCVPGRTITVMRGNGDGTFQTPREITVGSGTAAIGVGDFNRDGFKDLGLARQLTCSRAPRSRQRNVHPADAHPGSPAQHRHGQHRHRRRRRQRGHHRRPGSGDVAER